MVGSFNSDYYIVNGMVLESRKRREHLSEEDLQKNKAVIETLTRGQSQVVNGNGEQVIFAIIYSNVNIFQFTIIFIIILFLLEV